MKSAGPISMQRVLKAVPNPDGTLFGFARLGGVNDRTRKKVNGICVPFCTCIAGTAALDFEGAFFFGNSEKLRENYNNQMVPPQIREKLGEYKDRDISDPSTFSARDDVNAGILRVPFRELMLEVHRKGLALSLISITAQSIAELVNMLLRIEIDLDNRTSKRALNMHMGLFPSELKRRALEAGNFLTYSESLSHLHPSSDYEEPQVLPRGLPAGKLTRRVVRLIK